MSGRRIAILLAAGLALIGLVLFLVTGSADLDRPGAAADAGILVAAGDPLPSPAPSAEVDPTGAPARQEISPELAAPESAPPSAVDKTRLVFRGRCVAAETGAPLAGCAVNFSGWQGNSTLIALYGEPDWKDPDPVVTGEDGRFSFDVPETLPYQFVLGCRAPGRLGRADRYDTKIPGGTQFDLGDIPLPPGAEVTGMVRDEFGAPVENAFIYLENLPMEIRPGHGAGDSAGARSATDGSLRFEDAIPAGTWPIRLGAKDCTLIGPESATVAPGLVPVHLDLRVKRSPSIDGILVDENGQPVSRAYVQTVRHGSGRIEGDWTDAQGAFRIYRQRASEEPVLLELASGGLEPMRTEDAYAWGSRGVRLQSRRLIEVAVLVREQGSGAPVEEFSLRCHGTQANSSRQTDLRLGGAHPGGILTVGNVAYGENVLVVVPKDPALLTSAPLRFTAPRTDDAPLVVEVERLSTLRLRLVTPAGEPVGGSTVDLLDRAVPRQLRPRSLDPRGGWSGTAWSRPGESPVHWSSGTTDQNGEVAVYMPAGAQSAHAVVEGAHPRHAQDILRPFEQPQPILLEISLGATVRGRLIHPQAGSGKVGIAAIPPEQWIFGSDPWLPGADGRFEASGLEPGGYALHLAIFREYREGGFGSSGWMVLHPPLLDIALASGETREVELDGSAFAPASLRARVEIPDPTLESLAISLQMVPPPGLERRGQAGFFGLFHTEATRHFLAEDLPPGLYQAHAHWKDAGGLLRNVESRNRLEVRAGESATGTFEFVQRKLRLRVLDAEGRPLAGVRVRDEWFGEEGSPSALADADGWVEFDWRNPGPANLRLECDPPRFLGSVVVAADQEVTVVESRALTRDEWQAERERASSGG